MLGRYNLGEMTLRQKGEVVKWAGFSIAGLALLAIPVIFFWTPISMAWKYRKGIAAAKLGYEGAKAYRGYRKAKAAKA